MTLSEEATSRLTDIVTLQPTKNGELQDRWGLESGSEVHSYLESELKEYYYRDEDSLIRATPEAAELVGIELNDVVGVPPLQAEVIDTLAGPEEEPQSVVSVLHALEDRGVEADVDSARSALRGLADKGIVEIVRKTVPTFRLATQRSSIDVEVLDAPSEDT
ncbi:uncharacterized protein Nmlp_1299 [Natronomonas moolapensis 8.8.11]|uniref:Uncharacterized protein n=1 Tax=Natronomonas moolapensis (strain DSM 18674 / CECT 7526 / JCM 14361 / 8.8.11) TaxID=268739 RepID=M1XNJ5_NATM8|nr:DUF5797 family protein [Natronomonas moolapensis]CCQ35508.1 uncharacterized protein Nmlp_1299 [Natronomonas moolapensis 8.8.11]